MTRSPRLAALLPDTRSHEMGIKEFDFKQFFLEKGEKVGLGVAAAFMGLLLLSGFVSALTSGTASGTSADIEGKRKTAKNAIDSATPNSEDMKIDEKELAAQVSFDQLNPDEYRLANAFFTPSSIEDIKRRNPEILAPSEFQVNIVRGAVVGVYITANKEQVAVLVDKSTTRTGMQGNPFGGRFGQLGKGRGPGSGGRAPPGLGGDMGMGMGGMGGAGGPAPPSGEGSSDGIGGRPGGMPGMGGDTRRRQALEVQYLDFDKLEKRTDVRLAEEHYPMHIAVVSATFPLKQQWEEFRRALRKKDLAELAALNQAGEAPFQFAGYELQRRVLLPNGKVKDDWRDFTKEWTENLKWVFIRAKDSNGNPLMEEDPKLDPFVVDGLTGWQPKLAREQKYPEVKLSKIQEAIEKAKDEDKKARQAFAPKGGGRFSGEDFDPTNPRGFTPDSTSGAPGQPGQPGGPNMGGAGPTMPGRPRPPAGNAPEGPGEGTMTSEPSVPEYALLRFIDTSVEPGYTYQYRLKVKMVNPNYKRKDVAYASLAKTEKILAKDWVETPKVTVEPDSAYYVVDEKPERGQPSPPADKERMPIQIHRWISRMLTSPDNADTGRFFGHWSILERDLFYRGEYIKRLHDAEVPAWQMAKEGYELARGPKRSNKVRVEYSSQSPFTQTPAILVDFEGGNNVRYEVGAKDGPRRSVADNSPIQALVLSPDGKLMVRTSAVDAGDEQRKARVDELRGWIKDVKSGRLDKPGGPGGGDKLFDNPGS
jgi:hypothetical protein